MNTAIFVISLVAFVLILTFSILGIVFGALFWWLHRVKEETTRRWTQEEVRFLRGPEFINLSGIESRGIFQIRGNGFMALTDRDLRITRAVPAAEWRIPHWQLKRASLESSFLLKWTWRKVLVVAFEQEGRQDRIGIYVRGGAAWAEEINRVAGGKIANGK